MSRPVAVPAAGYAERLWPAWWLGLVVLLLASGFGLVAAPFGPVVMLVVGVLAAVALAGLLLGTAGTVAVTGGGEFVAGRARIPLALLGPVEVLDDAGMRHARGPELDARAYLCLRGWIGPGVRVAVTDPEDPAPYWLVSSRHPQRLAEALDALRAH